jgi:hypothetical protein
MPILRFRRFFDPPLAAAAAQISALRMGAKSLMTVSFACAIAAFGCIAAHRPIAGLGFIILNRLLAGIAKPLARVRNESFVAAYLGLLFEFLFRASLAFAFALADPTRALAAAFLMLSFTGSGTATLAFRTIANELRRPTNGDGTNGFHEDGAWGESVAAFTALAIACIVPTWFSVIAYALGVLGFVAMGIRVATAVEKLK